MRKFLDEERIFSKVGYERGEVRQRSGFPTQLESRHLSGCGFVDGISYSCFSLINSIDKKVIASKANPKNSKYCGQKIIVTLLV